MANKKIFIGMSVLALAFGMAIVGCDKDSGIDDGSETVKNLPAFEGSFVSSEHEASILALGADSQIQTAIAEALQRPATNDPALRATDTESGYYEFNGISLRYIVTETSSDNSSYPYSYTVQQIVTIDGIYGGYKIKGNYNLELEYTVTGLIEQSIKYNYDCFYTVSYNGMGMKIITTGDMIISSNSQYRYNLHYAIYDNNNIRRFNYDYKHP
jgi:hypothetical protein